jgi:hypothetical protein
MYYSFVSNNQAGVISGCITIRELTVRIETQESCYFIESRRIELAL